jgi:hypothetical protein
VTTVWADSSRDSSQFFPKSLLHFVAHRLMVSRVVAMLVLGRSDLARERVTNLSLSLFPEDTAGLTALRGAAYAPKAL